MTYNIIAILASIILPVIIIFPKIKKEKQEFFKKNKYNIILYIILVVGFITRSVGININPKGLNVDEASSGYDAYSILEFGCDRNGNKFPVFLEAWGSGQNALYSYLMIPFIKLFGLNVITTRLPMVILGCISLIVWYNLLNEVKNKKFAIIGLSFLVICPWNIMKSRWGLESNIFPDFVLYAIYFIVKFIKTNNVSKLYIASILLGVSSYTYGTSYFFLPIFCIIMYIYLLYTKKVNIKNVILSFSIIFIIALPIMLYIIINTFDLNQIDLGIITIPKLPVNRYEEQTSIFNGNILTKSIKNFVKSLKLLLTQDDGLSWNCIPGFGIFYIISIPFLVYGIIYSIKNKEEIKKYESAIDIWFISSFLLMFVLNEVNINRINVLIYPLIYYVINGIYIVVAKRNIISNSIILIVYIAFFVMFMCSYIFLKPANNYTFVDNIKEVIEYVEKVKDRKIYIEYAFKEPYIYVLYYTKYNTHDFIDSVQYIDNENLGKFDNIKSFGRYNFYIPDDQEKYPDAVFVVKKKKNKQIDYSKYKKLKEFSEYVVLEKK